MTKKKDPNKDRIYKRKTSQPKFKGQELADNLKNLFFQWGMLYLQRNHNGKLSTEELLSISTLVDSEKLYQALENLFSDKQLMKDLFDVDNQGKRESPRVFRHLFANDTIYNDVKEFMLRQGWIEIVGKKRIKISGVLSWNLRWTYKVKIMEFADFMRFLWRKRYIDFQPTPEEIAQILIESFDVKNEYSKGALQPRGEKDFPFTPTIK